MTHEPTSETRAQVKALAGVGLIQKHIAGYVGITQKTLRKHYAAELQEGMSSIVYKAAQVISKKINEEDAGAAKFLLRTRGGWKESREEESIGLSDGAADSGNNQGDADDRPKLNIMDLDRETRIEVMRQHQQKQIARQKAKNGN